MSEAIRSARRGAVLEITIDRPKANAIDAATSRDLGSAFLALRDDPELRVAIVTGAGERFFSAGWDLKAAAAGAEQGADHGPGGFAGLTERFDLDKPVIGRSTAWRWAAASSLRWPAISWSPPSTPSSSCPR